MEIKNKLESIEIINKLNLNKFTEKIFSSKEIEKVK